jgi:hypothetical protein
MLGRQHQAMRRRRRSLGPLPDRVWLGIALGVRELLREALEQSEPPRLDRLARDIRTWVTATIEGAAKARARPRT